MDRNTIKLISVFRFFLLRVQVSVRISSSLRGPLPGRERGVDWRERERERESSPSPGGPPEGKRKRNSIYFLPFRTFTFKPSAAYTPRTLSTMTVSRQSECEASGRKKGGKGGILILEVFGRRRGFYEYLFSIYGTGGVVFDSPLARTLMLNYLLQNLRRRYAQNAFHGKRQSRARSSWRKMSKSTLCKRESQRLVLTAGIRTPKAWLTSASWDWDFGV